MNILAILSSLLAVVIALAIVLGLAWIALRALKRWQDRFTGVRGEDDRTIRFLRALPVGQNERVAMIEVNDEVLLIGVTPGGVTLLRHWPAGAGGRAATMENPDA
ncbi:MULTISPECIES: flagellar biosynthetic protein FliO [unclassified Sphingomonas]|jgi:flagellar protein FliO/FliZ|uniref:flagellar biosynthetic protein FliO n=1 Tax=unclassified Sphingomonas TaxID=196159 RepID=UPI00082D0A26|nr:MULTISPECIES: flagellar biosynthetic protein FliO [unclassified Sphingomonas]